MQQLTKRQKKIYDFIASEIRNKQRPPTIREIGERFDIASPNGVRCHLKALSKKKRIAIDGNSRGIRLLGLSEVARLRKALRGIKQWTRSVQLQVAIDEVLRGRELPL